MKHHQKIKKLGRTKSQREALLCSLFESLVEHEQIQTTLAKAKAMRPFSEKLITSAKVDTPQNRRLVNARLKNRPDTVSKLFSEIAPRYETRPGGYLRITKIAPRDSDASPQAIIELINN